MKIHQLLTCLSYGDAISNYAIELRNILRKWGYCSEIFAEESHSKVRNEVLPFREYLETEKENDNIVIYHFSVGSVISHYLKNICGTKIMIYHNITPHEYFINIHPYLVGQIIQGRKELQEYTSIYELVIADSEYNKSELENYGYKNVVCIPIKPQIDNLSIEPSPSLISLLQDGKKNILFVGRITPNKGHADLIKSFYYLKKSCFHDVRLIMVGEYKGFEAYHDWLEDLIRQLNLDDVLFPGLIDYEDLVAYYKTADLFVCLSQHEGFCVPLLESMYFHVPVIALGKTAVPYTLRGAGLEISTVDYWKIAELMGIVLEDKKLRDKLVLNQDKVFRYYQTYDLEKDFKKYLEPYLP